MQALQELQAAAGATFTAIENRQVPLSFGNDEAAFRAATDGVAVCDRSHWGRIEVSDADRLRFLHNQTTNNFQSLQPGQGCDTVFVTSTARTIDLATAYVTEDAVLLLVSPNRCQYLMKWMDRYIFFADKVKLKDVTDAIATFSLIGPQSETLLAELGVASTLAEQSYGTHTLAAIDGIDVRIAVGNGLALPGYTLITQADQATKLWEILTANGAVPMGEQVWEQWRVLQGRPVPEQELTEEFNPLEVGLWNTISLTKGCYIGQETIARLHTYRGVKQQLWGIKLTAPVEPSSVVLAGEEKVGQVTSCTTTADGYFALAYIRTKAIEAGIQTVHVGAVHGELVSLPFVSHEYI